MYPRIQFNSPLCVTTMITKDRWMGLAARAFLVLSFGCRNRILMPRAGHPMGGALGAYNPPLARHRHVNRNTQAGTKTAANRVPLAVPAPAPRQPTAKARKTSRAGRCPARPYPFPALFSAPLPSVRMRRITNHADCRLSNATSFGRLFSKLNGLPGVVCAT